MSDLVRDTYHSTTYQPSPRLTLVSSDYSPASDSESDPSEDPSLDHIPPLPAISPFLSSDDDTTDSDTPDTPLSPTYGMPFTEITTSTQRSPVIPRRRVMILSPGQPIPHGRPYRYHLNRPIHMMTARKRVRPFLIPQLAVGHPIDHSSLDYFSPDDSARDSSSDSPSQASPYFHSDASSDSPSGHSLSDHSSPDLPSTFVGPSSKRCRSPMTSVPALSPISGALSPVHVEVDHKEISLRDDAIVRVNALRDRGINARVVVEAVDRDETETGVRGPVEVRVERVMHPRFHDHTQAIPVHHVQAIEGVQREQGHRMVGVESAVIAFTERIAKLERDNRRLRDTMSVESQRVDRLQRGMSRMQREKMPNTRSGASMTHEEVEELVNRRVAEEIEAHEATMNLEPMNENRDEQEGGNGGNGGNRNRGNRGNRNGGNGENGNGGNGHRNGNHGMNYGGFMSVARECTFQDFLKCKPHNFSGTEGVVGLTR
ncbi:hypothetical protein Tco_0809341 [Tanacetum coccineum]